jgi:hypothetical protein
MAKTVKDVAAILGNSVLVTGLASLRLSYLYYWEKCACGQ